MKIGDAFRVASLVKGTNEAVGGVIVARSGANPQQVIDGVKARHRRDQAGPAGRRHDRAVLRPVDAHRRTCIGTLRVALLEEILLVTLAHIIFLMHFRSILIVTLPLPLAVLMSFLVMRYTGVTSNLMSLAGIAIAIGVLVDAGIVVTENAFRHIENERDRHARSACRAGSRSSSPSRLVGRPVFFSMAIILLAFVPVFALTGQEGKLFHPLAFTKTFAVLAATVMAVTLVPVLCTLLLGGRMHAEADNPVMRVLRPALLRRSLSWALRHRARHARPGAALLVGALGRRIAHRQRVHAAAQRRRPAVHADRRPERVARREHATSRSGRTPRCCRFRKWTWSSPRSRAPTPRPIRRRST